MCARETLTLSLLPSVTALVVSGIGTVVEPEDCR